MHDKEFKQHEFSLTYNWKAESIRCFLNVEKTWIDIVSRLRLWMRKGDNILYKNV